MSGYYDYHPQVNLRCPLVLTGLTTDPARRLGHWLASTEGLPIIDLDRRVEHVAGESIWRLIGTQGEAPYRALEREALAAALRALPVGVIVGGDGLTLDDENRASIASATRWVALVASNASVAQSIERTVHPSTGFWHPTRREIFMDEAQLHPFLDPRRSATAHADAVIDIDAYDERGLRQRILSELPLAE